LSVRRDRNTEEKHKIAAYAAELIEADDFVYLDAGSSVDLLIDELNEESAVFVTNAIGHAQKLLKKGYEVLLIGGKLKGVIPGGASAPMLTAAECGVLTDYDSLAKAGTMAGSGGLIVIVT
jgi:hypothetical protein